MDGRIDGGLGLDEEALESLSAGCQLRGDLARFFPRAWTLFGNPAYLIMGSDWSSTHILAHDTGLVRKGFSPQTLAILNKDKLFPQLKVSSLSETG